MTHENHDGEQCRCEGNGYDDEGCVTWCTYGDVYREAREREFGWMRRYVRDALQYERDGDHEAAEAIRTMVCS